MESGTSFNILTNDPVHQREQLNSALDLGIQQDTDMFIISKDRQYLPCHRALLSLFSPLVRRLLADVPCCVAPTIFLPDFPAHLIRKFLHILKSGQAVPGKNSNVDIKFLRKIGDALSVDLGDLSTGQYVNNPLGSVKIKQEGGGVISVKQELGIKQEMMQVNQEKINIKRERFFNKDTVGETELNGNEEESEYVEQEADASDHDDIAEIQSEESPVVDELPDCDSPHNSEAAEQNYDIPIEHNVGNNETPIQHGDELTQNIQSVMAIINQKDDQEESEIIDNDFNQPNLSVKMSSEKSSSNTGLNEPKSTKNGTLRQTKSTFVGDSEKQLASEVSDKTIILNTLPDPNNPSHKKKQMLIKDAPQWETLIPRTPTHKKDDKLYVSNMMEYTTRRNFATESLLFPSLINLNKSAPESTMSDDWKHSPVEKIETSTPILRETESAYGNNSPILRKPQRTSGNHSLEITKEKSETNLNNVTEQNDNNNTEPKDGSFVNHLVTLDPLAKHIKDKKFPLIFRKRTRSDGNCWYDATADQVKLHNVKGVPKDHEKLREAVCDAMLTLPQKRQWIFSLFDGKESKFLSFVKKHRKLGQWTDKRGLMCQATALFVGRNINIVGSANKDSENGFTPLESTDFMRLYPSFTIGYYQDLHYQSLSVKSKEEKEVGIEEKQFEKKNIDYYSKEKTTSEKRKNIKEDTVMNKNSKIRCDRKQEKKVKKEDIKEKKPEKKTIENEASNEEKQFEKRNIEYYSKEKTSSEKRKNIETVKNNKCKIRCDRKEEKKVIKEDIKEKKYGKRTIDYDGKEKKISKKREIFEEDKEVQCDRNEKKKTSLFHRSFYYLKDNKKTDEKHIERKVKKKSIEEDIKENKSEKRNIDYDCKENKTIARRKNSEEDNMSKKKSKIQCDSCPYTSSDRSNMNKHIKGIHEGIKFKCNNCSYKASCHSNLTKHINSMHM